MPIDSEALSRLARTATGEREPTELQLSQEVAGYSREMNILRRMDLLDQRVTKLRALLVGHIHGSNGKVAFDGEVVGYDY